MSITKTWRLLGVFFVAAALIGCGDDEAPFCGDGVVDAAEACDDGNTDWNDSCLPSCLLARCGDGYVLRGTETCDDGNQVNDDGCTSTCTFPRCGDGVVQAGEGCDDGNATPYDDCLNSCVLSHCGDGFVQDQEECDDGNFDNSDSCLTHCVLAGCGDGLVWLGVEACDDGNDIDVDGCTNLCGLPTCGDGLEQTGEECDDGNLDNHDACLSSCLSSHCGDRFIRLDIDDPDQPGFEECDDGNLSNHDDCLDTCVWASCGDGFVWAWAEECDDGNDEEGDGCNRECTRPRCGNAIVDTGEACDDGNANPTDACLNDCTPPYCGDGILRRDLVDPDSPGFEACDDGNQDDTDACLNDCRLAFCGDGVVWRGVESCDPPSLYEDGTCTATCTFVGCGDGVVQSPEECDDGNADNRDECLANCVQNTCGDGFLNDGIEACDDGNSDDHDACLHDCSMASCGDGIVRWGLEECDDGDDDNSNDCTNNCRFPFCGDSILQAGETCDDGNSNNNDACLVDCLPARCGDNIVRIGVEQCDDANRDNTDSCVEGCFSAVCQDGYVHFGVEACDDGNFDNQDACTNDCTAALCGDGITYRGVEQCEDGNASNTDACLNNCSLASCGDGYVWAGVEECDDSNAFDHDTCLSTCRRARCGDGILQIGVEACDDGNQDNTDVCLSHCHEFLWCEGYGIDELQPAVTCVTDVPPFFTIEGAAFYEIDGAVPLVTFAGQQVEPTMVEDSCQDLLGMLTEVRQCQQMTVALNSDIEVGDYQVEVLERLTAGCSDVAVFSVGPVPEVEIIAPSPICDGERTLTFGGNGFVNGTLVAVVGVDDGLTYEPETVDVITSSELQATFADLPSQRYDAWVSNGGACADWLLDALEVIEAPLSVFADPPVLHTEIKTRIVIYLSDLIAADIIYVAIRPNGTDEPFLLVDHHFNDDEPGEVQADVPAGLEPGVYDLIVRDSALCTAPLSEAFRVTDNDNLDLVGIDPPFGWSGSITAVTLVANDDPGDPEVNGFESLPTVFLNPSGDESDALATRLSGVAFLSSSELTAVVPAGLIPGSYDVYVVNPDGSLGEVGILQAGFEVTELPPPVIDLVGPSNLPRREELQEFVVEGANFRDPYVTLICRNRDGDDIPTVFTNQISFSEDRVVAEVDTSDMWEGWVCVVRVTNNDDGSYGDFSALAIIRPSRNPYDFLLEPTLLEARRAPAVTGGAATRRARFLYVIGGDDPDSSEVFSSIEVGQLDRFGNLIEQEPGIGFRMLREDRWLAEGRTQASAETVGRFIYVAGGTIEGQATATVRRAEILRPQDAPSIDRVAIRVVDSLPAIADEGVYYYRLAAVMPPGDPDNPNGETLPGDPQPVRVPVLVDDLGDPLFVEVTLRWVRETGDPTRFRLYRTPTPAPSPGTERLLAIIDCESEGVEDPCELTDDGSWSFDGTEDEPRQPGDIGVWLNVDSMETPREAFGFARAEEPNEVLLPDRYYLYAIAGRDNEDVILDDYEVLSIQIDQGGSHTIADWVADEAIHLSVPRWQLAAYAVDRTVTDRVDDSRDVWIYAGGGRQDGIVNNTDSAQVQSGGFLDSWQPEFDMNNRTAYGHAALGDQLYAFGGRAGNPNRTADSIEVCIGTSDPGDPLCPTLDNWNNMEEQLNEERVWMGSTVHSARIFIVGGMNEDGAVDTVESVVW